MTAAEIISLLGLEQHPLEGGYFRKTYESSLDIGNRRLLTSIYYLLTKDSPVCFLHRNRADILHYHHLGAPITYVIIAPDGKLAEKILGPDLQQGQRPQLLVPGGYWKAAQLCAGDYALISEAVSPGFVYADNEIATEDLVGQHFPEMRELLKGYIKRDKQKNLAP